MMKILFRIFILMIVLASVSNLKAQQEKHFIFIQSENKQPYYIQLNGQTYSSTKSGYATISQLLAGKYYLTIGFPKNQHPEQKFILDINMTDGGLGFSLKQFIDKGWGLFNIVDYSIIMADNDAGILKKDTAVAIIAKTDSVSPKMINEKEIEKPVTSIDTAVILKNTTIETSSKIAAPLAAVTVVAAATIANDTATGKPPGIVDTTAVLKNTALNDPPVITKKELAAIPAISIGAALTDKPIPIKKKIIKSFEMISSMSIDQIYVDQSRKKADTIAIFIPLTQKIDTVVAVKKCQVVATEDDFHRIRLDMAAATTNDFMIITAKNLFKTKCYSVEQIKNLGVLFLSEESRFHFFEIAKPFMADAENYSSLQSQFTESEWIEKFKASVKNN